MGEEKSLVEQGVAAGAASSWRSCRALEWHGYKVHHVWFLPAGAGKVAWTFEDVSQVALSMAEELPPACCSLIESGQWRGGPICKLDDPLQRPSAADVSLNFHLLRPVLKHTPNKAECI